MIFLMWFLPVTMLCGLVLVLGLILDRCTRGDLHG